MDSLFQCFPFFHLLDIDDCAKKPCRNGGRCVDKVNSYQCICKTGYSGLNCGTSKINFSTSERKYFSESCMQLTHFDCTFWCFFLGNRLPTKQ